MWQIKLELELEKWLKHLQQQLVYQLINESTNHCSYTYLDWVAPSSVGIKSTNERLAGLF